MFPRFEGDEARKARKNELSYGYDRQPDDRS
jgi:hypothetical protein